MPTKLLLCLLLIGLSLPAAAREEVTMTASDGDCTAVQDTEADATRGTEKRTLPAAGKARPAARRGGSDAEAATRAPRWHSFLPGMFR